MPEPKISDTDMQLTSYEVKGGGSWSGRAPAHVELSAHGLQHFDMKKVYPVNKELLTRTRTGCTNSEMDEEGTIQGRIICKFLCLLRAVQHITYTLSQLLL